MSRPSIESCRHYRYLSVTSVKIVVVLMFVCLLPSDFQRLMRSGFESCASGLALADNNPIPPGPKSPNTGASRLSDDTAPGTVNYASDASRQTGNRRDRTPTKAIAATEERAKATRGSTRRRSNGGISFSDVAVRGARAETRSLGVQSLHVGHGLLCTQKRAGCRLGWRGQVG